MMDGSSGRVIPTNLRLLLVLEEVVRVGVPVTPTEVNAQLNLPKPTIHRLFATLEKEGFLQKDIDGSTYSPGYRLRELATGVLSSLRIRSARLAILRNLSEKIGETCNIALPDRDAMTYLERVETKWPLRIQLPIGTSVPFHCTASGKMYLSTLPDSHLRSFAHAGPLSAQTSKTLVDPEALIAEIRETQTRGYAVDTEEFMDGMVAVAVPIKGAENRLVATLSFHAPTQRFSIERAIEFLPDLKAAADALSALLQK